MAAEHRIEIIPAYMVDGIWIMRKDDNNLILRCICECTLGFEVVCPQIAESDYTNFHTFNLEEIRLISGSVMKPL